ncbi:uncharacterized protein GJ701_001957 isoform 1-T1 [Geothlypis trichas]
MSVVGVLTDKEDGFHSVRANTLRTDRLLAALSSMLPGREQFHLSASRHPKLQATWNICEVLNASSCVDVWAYFKYCLFESSVKGLVAHHIRSSCHHQLSKYCVRTVAGKGKIGLLSLW